MKAVATCLAIIAAVEVPDGMDESFLQNFSNYATQDGQSYQNKLTAIQTLGLMCDFIEVVGKRLQPAQLAPMLHATLCNIDGSQQNNDQD